MDKEFHIQSLQDLPSVAKEFLNTFPDCRIFAFNGKMGAGKTTFIKALCNVLGVEDNVCSPSFAIVNVDFSPSCQEVYHFDFYRLTNPMQALDIGTEEYFYSGQYCFIEWGENIGDLIPEDCIFADIEELNGKSRKITVRL